VLACWPTREETALDADAHAAEAPVDPIIGLYRALLDALIIENAALAEVHAELEREPLPVRRYRQRKDREKRGNGS